LPNLFWVLLLWEQLDLGWTEVWTQASTSYVAASSHQTSPPQVTAESVKEKRRKKLVQLRTSFFTVSREKTLSEEKRKKISRKNV